MSRNTVKIVFFPIVSLFLISTFFGWKLGRYHSPKYDSESEALMYFNQYYEIHENGDKEIVLALRAGNWLYKYNVEDRELSKNIIPIDFINNHPSPVRNTDREFEELIAIAGILSSGPTVAATIRSASKTPKALRLGQRTPFYAIATIIGLSSGYLGYRLGYTDEVKYSASEYKSLFSNENVWLNYGLQIKFCETSLKVGNVKVEPSSKNDQLSGMENKLNQKLLQCERFLKRKDSLLQNKLKHLI